VEQPAEAITSPHQRGGRPQQSNHGAIGWSLIEGPVRSVPVDVIDVLGQHLFEVASVDDQYLVQAFAADAAHPPFCDRVRARCPGRAAHYGDAGRGEYRVEPGRERGVTIADQKPQTVRPLAEAP
jgi:hypothetical protein